MKNDILPVKIDPEKVKKEEKRLNILFKNLPKSQKSLAKSEIQRAAFLTAALEQLENDIKENGYCDTYKNGENQYGMKKSPAADLHVSFTKNLISVMKILHNLLESDKGEIDEFDDF